MKIIGIIGAIASGKSTVCDILYNKFGVENFDVDEINKNLLSNENVVFKVMDYFSDMALINNKLDTKYLRARIINSTKDRIFMENLMFPLIIKELEERISSSSKNNIIIQSAVVWKELILLFDKRILVKTTKELQLKRLLSRDKMSLEDSENIINIQKDFQYDFDMEVDNFHEIDKLKLKLFKLKSFF
jgi:dephospho-CoA kinase